MQSFLVLHFNVLLILAPESCYKGCRFPVMGVNLWVQKTNEANGSSHFLQL